MLTVYRATNSVLGHASRGVKFSMSHSAIMRAVPETVGLTMSFRAYFETFVALVDSGHW